MKQQAKRTQDCRLVFQSKQLHVIPQQNRKKTFLRNRKGTSATVELIHGNEGVCEVNEVSGIYLPLLKLQGYYNIQDRRFLKIIKHDYK